MVMFMSTIRREWMVYDTSAILVVDARDRSQITGRLILNSRPTHPEVL